MKRRMPAFLTAVLLLLVTLSACGGSGGSSGDSYYYYTEAAESPSAWMDEEDAAYYYDDSSGDSYGDSKGYSSANMAAPVPSPDTPAGSTGSTEAHPQKLIRTAELSMETTDFEETSTALADLTERLGGYFADSTSGERGGSSRWANYTIRIPVNNFQTFLDQASQLCHETRHHISQEDISERYYDTAGRLRTQNIKLQRLQALLEKATSMEDIITIQSAISETEQAIDELSGTLRHYDNQVDYSTITLSLEEVYRFSNVPETPKSYPSLLGSAFVDGLRNFGQWLEDVTVALAYSWPWLVLIALAVFVVVRWNRQQREKRQNGRKEGTLNNVHLPRVGIGLKKNGANPGKTGSQSEKTDSKSKSAGSGTKETVTGEPDAAQRQEPPTQK